MKYFIVSLAAVLLSACVSAPSELYGIHEAKPEKNDQQHVSVDVAHSASMEDAEGQH